MRLPELKAALRQADPAAVLVSQRVLERLIQQERKLPTFLWEVPHRKVHVLDRHVLFRHVEQDELDLEPDRLLPSTVILLARPSPEDLANVKPEDLLLEYWRRLFHANVHLVLEKRLQEDAAFAAALPDRIEQLGRAEFAEIRRVLDQDGMLLPPADDRTVYVEFVAVYLELSFFAANLLPVYFPAIIDFDRVDHLLAGDVDGPALFAKTRLGGAPEPVVRTDNSSDESHDFYWRLIHRAERAARAGNTVRAAIVRTKAARVAPAALTPSTRAEAEADLQRLIVRLQAALQLDGEEAAEWLKDLPALLDKADQGDQGSRPVEAGLLYDLQNVCLEHERDIYALDLVEWLLSAGKRPIKRPLPSQRLVRVMRQLRSAAQRLTSARLSDAERQHLSRLMQTALNRCEERMRERFRPLLTDAFHDVGLNPENPPERTAFNKVLEELLDRVAEHGYLTFGDLRDTVSRNQMKLPDLAEPHEFVRGDPLLRLDRRLGTLLDGVYRPGEFYLRVLERFTALGFGTDTGRRISRNFVFPFGGAFLLVFAFVHIMAFFTGAHLRPVVGPEAPSPFAHVAGDSAAKAQEKEQPKAEPPKDEAAEPAPVEPSKAAPPPPPPQPETRAPPTDEPAMTPWTWGAVAGVGLFLLLLIRYEGFREWCRRMLIRLGRLLQFLFIDGPAALLKLGAVQRLMSSWSFQLFHWYVFKPLVAAVLVLPLLRGVFTDWRVGVLLIFFVSSVVLNSRFGQGATDAVTQGVVRLYELLRAGLLPGLYRLVMQAFKRTVEVVEGMLYSVDEWLRFRSGDSRFSLVVRAVLGVLWYPVSFLTRLYLVVLIEPGFNPIKAPLSILFAKIVYPLLITGLREATFWQTVTYLAALWAEPLTPWVGEGWAWLIGWCVGMPTLWLLPDACTFFFWEMKENWRLYRANRPAKLRTVPIGLHGETMAQLLRPGFHSGTVPGLYARLRHAERAAARTGNWRAARTYRRSLQEVERTLQRFVSRELVPLLLQSPSWRGQKLSVGWVTLASNRIRVELIHDDYPADSVLLEFEDQAGWLVASVRDPGWLPSLTPEQRQTVTAALAGLYKLAGVDLVHEQLESNLPARFYRFDLTPRDLVLWTAPPPGEAVSYDLGEPRGTLRPRRAGGPAPDEPLLDANQLVFAQIPIYWEQWVAAWQKDQEGKGPPRLFGADLKLLPPLHAPPLREPIPVVSDGVRR
jgi:hypothetical protein